MYLTFQLKKHLLNMDYMSGTPLESGKIEMNKM